MAVATPANPRDVQEFQFKLCRRLRIFTAQDGTYTNAVNLVTAASKYGLLFVGCPTGVQVILSSSIIGLEGPSGGSGGEISNYPRREIPLTSQPSHLGVSCDQNYLVVAAKKDGCDHAYIYSIPSFVAKNVALVSEVRLSTKADTHILELTWNPGIPNILAACLSDGSMAAFELKPSGVEINTLPPATQATCFCWSPKGKQLVVGSETGTLTQYKPDLKAVKALQAPNLGSGNVSVVNVLWISNYQFAAVYRDKINTDDRPGLLIVNAPKTGALSFLNYEDICYSCGDFRLPQFYLIHQPVWNIIMVASANSMEVGVLGLQEDQMSWEQWTQEDAGRAELPLTVDKQETFPIGFGLDTSNQQELPWGENQSLAPMPVLHILSHQGVLCLFYAVNLRADAPCLCSPPERLPDESGLDMFTMSPVRQQTAAEIPKQPEVSSMPPGLANVRVNLAQKFDSISTPQSSSSLFSIGASIPGASSGMITTTSSNLGKPPATSTPLSFSFNANITSTSSSTLATTVPSISTTKSPSSFAMGSASTSTIFGGSSSLGSSVPFGTCFGSTLSTGLNIPSTNAFLGSTTTPNFNIGIGSAPSSTFGAGIGNAPSISSGTSANTQSFIGSGLNFNKPPALGLGSTSIASDGNAPAVRPAFSFLSTPSTAADSAKPGLAQTSGFTFSVPVAATQQVQKSTTQQTILQPQVTTVQQTSFISGNATSVLHAPERSNSSSVTVTKVQPIGAPQVAQLDKPTLQTETKQGPPSSKSTSSAISNSVFYQAIAEEVKHFERELSGLRSRVNGIVIQVGSEEEKRMLHKKVDNMDEFWRELKETTQAQNLEIHSLKSLFMEAFAWVAEAKSRAQHLNSPMYVQVARSQALDPVSARYADDIKHLVYYVENQLRQINEHLDSSWLEFQDSCKPTKKSKLYIPTLEAVYQAMVMHNNILNKQRVIMADVARRAQEHGNHTQIPLISSAVLARVRSKEASQIGKGENELARLAENLVQMKVGPSEPQTNHGVGLRCHRLTRKKESLLRNLLSQNTVTHICPVKPQRSMLGGISTGKPIVSMTNALSVTVDNKSNIGVSHGFAANKSKVLTQLEPPQVSPSQTGPAQPRGSMDASNRNISSKNFAPLGMKYVAPTQGPTIETLAAANSSFIFTSDASRTKPVVPGNAVISKPSTQTGANEFPSIKSALAGELTLNSAMQSGKSNTVGKVPFGLELTKTPSLSRLGDSSARLEEYYEELTPPGSPSPNESDSPTEIPVSNVLLGPNFSLQPSTVNLSIVTTTVSSEGSVLQKSPLMSLGSIVAGIGENSSVPKTAVKPFTDKPAAPVPSSNVLGGSAFSFGSLTLGQPQQGGSAISKPEDQKSSSQGFTFSLPVSIFGTVSSSAAPITGSATTSQTTPPKVTVGETNVSLKSPQISFGAENRQSGTPTQVPSIFGGDENKKSAFSGSGSIPMTSGSVNIFSQGITPAFGGLMPGSPSKQATSPGLVFGASPSIGLSSTEPVFNKQGSDSAASPQTSEAEQQKCEPSAEQSPAISSSADSFFSQNTSLFGNLSVGSGAASKPASAASIFGGGSLTPSANFTFGKQPATDVSKSTSSVPESLPVTSADSEKQKSESPSADVQSSPVKQAPTSGFSLSFAEPTQSKPDSSEGTENQRTLSSPLLTADTKTEKTTSSGLTFSFSSLNTGSLSGSTTQASGIFGQKATPDKPLAGSLFAATSTPVTTTTSVTSAASSTAAETQTTSAATTTFSFALPASTQSSTPFGQKSNLFGQPVSSATPTTSSSTSFFGQPVCSPSAFGQSGGSLFGQPSTTAAKTNLFGQTATTTVASVFGQGSASTTQSVFGQSSSPPSLFGQASSGSSFLGGSSGGFGSKPVFGQSGGSLFGGSSSFGSSGSSLFGGGSSIFGGSSGSQTTGNLFQSSTGGNIFGGSTSPSSGTTAGAFSSGLGQSISQSGFGSPTAFQSKPAAGFGGSPVFDRGSSGFGAPPTFGGAPTFGGSPTFGSPGKVFGSTSPTANVGFGSTGQQSSTFESLATQNTMTFGNLAQNQGQSFGSQPVFGGSPQNTQSGNTPAFSGGSSSFGGSSFSSWR